MRITSAKHEIIKADDGFVATAEEVGAESLLGCSALRDRPTVDTAAAPSAFAGQGNC